jgi:alginate O-acetyltransferase complex protein AlgI
MLIVVVGWVFFRSANFIDALIILRSMFSPQPGIIWMAAWGIVGILFLVVTHTIQAAGWRRLIERQADHLVSPITLFVLIWLIIIYYPHGFQPFVYFQF